MLVRPAHPSDTQRIGEILVATAAEPPTSLDSYLAAVAAHGALLVCDDGPNAGVAGFGGVIALDDGSAFVTDLFVDPLAQGRGVGGALLDALVDGRPRRTTFSSGHVAAVPVYRRRGMMPRWTLQYRRGAVRDLGPIHPGRHGPDVVEVDVPGAAAASLLGRPWLVQWFADRGASCLELRADHGRRTVGAAIVTARPDGTRSVERLVATSDHAEAAAAVLAWLGVGAVVSCCVPADSPAAGLLDRMGFGIVDADTCCSTEAHPMPSHLVALHPGLG